MRICVNCEYRPAIKDRRVCRSCRSAKSIGFKRTKGVREYNKIITYFLILDRLRGATLEQLAKSYKLDKNNIDKRIKGVLNKKYYERVKYS